ncbi:MAG TPA: radical SAM protein [Thermoanaerobaculaceae bacterium]|nr:radical SAM protein [Thermoanaerobaculaceae bacterium]HRS16409.1 radical SAM protein [Thermoanaerobaculaceae bacterium]
MNGEDPRTTVLLDRPTPDRPIRLYVAITNACNRGCPWCSACARIKGRTFLSPERFRELLPAEGAFQVQLEGGEPLCHPDFWSFVEIARAHPGCQRLVLCTNGTLLPRRPRGLLVWLGKLGTPLSIKLSFNHFLLERDPHLVQLATLLRDLMGRNPERALVINVRRRRGVAGDDQAVVDLVERAGLLPFANIFYLQRYGNAARELDWEAPRVEWDNFRLINPDGRVFGPDLVARAEAMRLLP